MLSKEFMLSNEPGVHTEMNKTMARCSWFFGGFLFPVLAAAVPITLMAEASRRSADASDLRVGVIVDPSGSAVYSMNPDGGIDAVSPSTGELLWSTSEAARPLALHGDRLIAQGPPDGRTGVLDVVFLGAGDGERRRTLSMELAGGVWAAVDLGMSTTFEARAVILEDEPYLLWDHTRRHGKGIAPEPGTAFEQRLAGAFRLDLVAGRAVAVDPETLKLETTLPSAVRQWADSGELSTAPAPAGEVLAGTQVVGERIVLKRWSPSGAPLPDIDIFSGPYVLEIRSADGRHLLVSERVAPGDWEEYGWWVFSLESGRRLGQVRNHRSHAWYVVHDSTLIYVVLPHGRRVGGEVLIEPLTLRAVLLDGATVIWERPLRDTSYQGPFPP